MVKLVLASRNKHKIEELKQLTRHLNIEVCSALDFAELEDVIEDRDTLEGNALKKAHYVAETTGFPALSDDTGLEVDALHGAPGVYSARYAGEEATYQDNVNKLLLALETETNRKAQFRTVVALVSGDTEVVFEGICPGQITTQQIGDQGFGYDPVFIPDGFTQTFAELPPELKNKISHRGIAMEKCIEYLSNSK